MIYLALEVLWHLLFLKVKEKYLNTSVLFLCIFSIIQMRKMFLAPIKNTALSRESSFAQQSYTFIIISSFKNFEAVQVVQIFLNYGT